MVLMLKLVGGNPLPSPFTSIFANLHSVYDRINTVCDQ